MSIFFLLRFYKDPFDNSTVLVLMGLSCLNIRSIIHVKDAIRSNYKTSGSKCKRVNIL